jgi:hypothetical protein
VQLLAALREKFPTISFEILDPNEEWDVPEHMVVIDTVINLTDPQTIQGLDAFMSAPRMTCHDFDAYANLMFMKKLGKIRDVTILGLPPQYDKKACISWLTGQIDKELQY